MTRVCLVGEEDVNLRYELLSRETSRQALQTYDLRAPFENTVGLETVSLGAAVSLLGDLNWYIVRFVSEGLVLEPSVSESEWLSRELATTVRDDEIAPDETGRLLKVYGVERPDGSGRPGPSDADSGTANSSSSAGASDGPARPADEPASDDEPPDAASPGADGAGDGGTLPRLVEPMLVTRTGDTIPEYDIRDVDETLVVRVTEAEFEKPSQ